MKEGLIKINGEDHLYYDSIIKQYKYVMHCPKCSKYSGCWCFPDFENIPSWEGEYPNVYCSDKCFVLDSISELQETASEIGIKIHPKMEEWNASKIVRAFMEGLDLNYDFSGELCEVNK